MNETERKVMKAKPLEFKFLGNGLYQALTMDGSYCVYRPMTFPGCDFDWTIQFRDEFGGFGNAILRSSLELVKARCEELHQEAFAELIEYWGAP